MPISNDDKQQVKSVTISEFNSLISSESKRVLNDKLLNRNSSSGFKPKRPQHSQDRECGALIKSCSQKDARGIGNFKHGHRRQPKIQTIVGATKSGVYDRLLMNRQHPHATVESEKKRIQTVKDKLGNHHNDPDHTVNERIWYKYVWGKLKKQAKKITDSKADADSSSDESISDSDAKQTMLQKSQKKSINTHATKRPSGNKLEKHFVSEYYLKFDSSEGVKILSWDKVSYSKILPTSFALSPLNSTEQESVAYCNSLADIDLSDMTGEKSKEDRDATRLTPEETLSTLSDNWINVLPEEVRRKFINRSKSIHSEDSLGHFRLLVEILTTGTSEKIEDKPLENREDTRLMFEQILSMLSNDQDRDATLVTPEEIRSLLLDNLDSLDYVSFFPDIALSDKTGKKSKITVTSASRLYAFTQTLRTGVAEPDRLAHLKKLVDIATTSLKTIEKVVENWEDTRLLYEQILSMLSNDQITVTSASRLYIFPQTLRTGVAEPNTGNGENKDTHGQRKYNVDQEKKDCLDYVTFFPDIALSDKTENKSKINVLPVEVRRKFINRSKSLHYENSLAHLKFLADIITASEKTGEKPVEITVTSASRLYASMQTLRTGVAEPSHKSTEASEGSADRPIHHNDSCSDDHGTTFNSQEDNNTGMPGCMIDETTTDTSSDESLSTVESTRIRLYRNVIRNETSRMMSSIDRVISEAEQLFGLERSQIFFDLLAAELCQFGSAGAIYGFVPNMAESTVRQNVISFFEKSWETMYRQMKLLLRCPNSTILQQLPVQHFLSLMESVIKSTLNTTTKGKEKLSLEENMGMVDLKEFERSVGEEIPEDVLNRLRLGDEMVIHRFVDTGLERHQPSDRTENRVINSIYFPSDC